MYALYRLSKLSKPYHTHLKSLPEKDLLVQKTKHKLSYDKKIHLHHYFNDVALSPNGKRIAVSIADNVYNCIVIMDIETGEMVGEKLCRQDSLENITKVHWSPKGTSIAGFGHGKFYIWDVENAQEPKPVFENRAIYNYLSWNADETMFAATKSNGIAVWDTTHYEELKNIKIAHDRMRSITWHPTNPTQFVVENKSTIDLYEIKDNKSEIIKTMDGKYKSSIIWVAWSPDGTKLAAHTLRDVENDVRIWDTSSWTIKHDLDLGNKVLIKGCSWHPSGDIITLVVIDYPRKNREQIQFWHLPSNTLVESMIIPATDDTQIYWTPDGFHFLYTYKNRDTKEHYIHIQALPKITKWIGGKKKR